VGGTHEAHPLSGRRAKIVCTLGPASGGPERVAELARAGMDVARLNLSHGSRDDHARLVEAVEQARRATSRPLAVLADLQGPKLRIGTFAEGEVKLEEGRAFALDPDRETGGADGVSVSHAGLADDVEPGHAVLLSDGRVRLEVTGVNGRRVETRVLRGGAVPDRAGMNLPDSALDLPPLTEKDERDAALALSLGVDWLALSFVRSARDAEPLRRLMEREGRAVPVVAKIERPEAVRELESVIAAFDGVMVARGDLGVEVPLERVPLVQRRAIDLARTHARPAIVATQMLDSMIQRATPTRAEVSDVATAVRDGADALMLSGETSIGAHPVEAVRVMDRIVRTIEADGPEPRPVASRGDRADAVAASAIHLVRETGADGIAVFTASGSTALRVARHRCPVPLVALTPDRAVRRKLQLVWGVETEVIEPLDSSDRLVGVVDRVLQGRDRGWAGRQVVIVAGLPLRTPGLTNVLRLHEVGSAQR
jgi:pyruvate kinase